MNNYDAKFILGVYRPDGRDADNPIFTEPLAQTARDPELRDWLERQQRFDAAVANKVAEIAPPAGLRDAILAGARASQPRRRWWQNPVWLAAAAVLVIGAVVTFGTRPAAGLPTTADLAAFALNDLAEAHHQHDGHAPALAAVQTQLANARLPVTQHLSIDLAELRRRSCRRVQIAGREVFEICFQRNGTWYHVYVGRRSDFAPVTRDAEMLIQERGQLASTAWSDSTRVYALVTRAGAEALQRVL